MQREAIGELLADLLLDAEVAPGQLTLLLPLAGGHWRVLDGATLDQVTALEASQEWLDALDWPLQPTDSYCSLAGLGGAVMAIGVSRTLLQAWIDVVEMADLPLHRVNWTLLSACRGLNTVLGDWTADVAWLFPDGPALRMVLIRAGVPEVDQIFKSDQPDRLRQEIRRCVAAWQSEAIVSAPLGWWLSFSENEAEGWLPLIDPDRGEQRLDAAMTWSPDPVIDESSQDTLSPLDQLGLYGMVLEAKR